MNSKDILNNIKYLKIYNELSVDIDNVTIDTRKVKECDLYVAVKGERVDGNSLFMEAFLKGASIVIGDNIKVDENIEKYLLENNKCIILVQDSIITLGELAKYKRSLFTKPVVAITGSAGKTSTKDMIYSVLKEEFNVHKTVGNQNNHIGLPLTILSLKEDKDILVVEMGMNHLGEISYLSDIAKPDVAIITNVGTAHIGNLGSREKILEAKLEILDGLKANGPLFINIDNDLLYEWYLENKDNYNIKTYGINNDAMYRAININSDIDKSEFVCNDELIKVPIGGEHFIYNALVSLSIGKYFNISLDKIQRGLTDFELSRNRMNIIKKDNITIIDDCYNSNFDSLSYSIKYLSSMPGRRIAVIGTMLELGEFSQELHLQIGDLIYKENIDILITVGEYTELINKRALNNGFEITNNYHYKNNQEAIKKLNELKMEDDVILIKASYSLNFKEIVEELSK